jgi:hypothetical protein
MLTESKKIGMSLLLIILLDVIKGQFKMNNIEMEAI